MTLTVLLDRLAQRIVEGDVPQALMNRKVHSLCASQVLLTGTIPFSSPMLSEEGLPCP